MRFNRTVVLAALAGAFVILLSSSSAALADARNVVLIIADDQGRDLGVYGNPVLRTPNLDRLAARGTLFTSAFATVSSCSPSRSVIYTGLYSHSNGMYGLAHDVHNQHLLPSVRTLPQYLKAAGYRTGLVGKKHILPESQLPFDEELAPERPGNRDVAFMADEARKFISRNAGKPFLLIVGYSDPHRAEENFGNTRAWPRVARATYDPAKK
jgi:N-sulfoglucosamine sulfohydrolase